MRRLSRLQYTYLIKAQGYKDMEHVVFRCPACNTLQSMADMKRATAGRGDIDDIDNLIGFVCIGTFTDAGDPPRSPPSHNERGCNWSLGGVKQTHKIEVVGEDGSLHPRFEVASKEEARRHWRRRMT